MKVEDMVYVIERGNIIVTDLEDNIPLHINDKLKISDNGFEITGIEMASHSKRIGLILRPNPTVKEAVKIKDDIIKL